MCLPKDGATTKITGRLQPVREPEDPTPGRVGEAGMAGGSESVVIPSNAPFFCCHQAQMAMIKPRDSTRQNWPLYDFFVGLRPSVQCGVVYDDIIRAAQVGQRNGLFLYCSSQRIRTLHGDCATICQRSIFALRACKYPSKFIPCSYLSARATSRKTGFHLPWALATARRLAVLETLVPNSLNQPPIPRHPP